MVDNAKGDSFDTNTVKRSNSLNLYNLPVLVLEKVTIKLPLVDCLALRKVSRDLRDLVDSSKAHCDRIDFKFTDHWARVNLNNSERTYEENEDGGCDVSSYRNDTQKTKKYRDDRNWKQVMFADVATFLKNSKLEIGEMRLEVVGTAAGLELKQFLESLNFRINVKSIRSRDLKPLHLVQEFLNPEKLEEILCIGVITAKRFNEMAETNLEVLKNPKLKFEEILFDDYSGRSAVKFAELLQSINNQLRIRSVVVADGRWIRSIVQSLHPEKVERVTIQNLRELNADQFNAIAGKKQWKMKTKLMWSETPEEIGLEELVDFMEVRSDRFNLTEENLIKIRDILLKSPHLQTLELRSLGHNENIEEKMREMNETIDRIMSQHTLYDARSRRYSIPFSRDFFQIEFDIRQGTMVLTIERTSPL